MLSLVKKRLDRLKPADNADLLPQRTAEKRKSHLIFLLFAGIILVLFSEFYMVTGVAAQNAVNSSIASISSILFWSYFGVMLLVFPLRDAVISALGLIKRKLWALALFTGYLTVHLVIYGVLLELMLASIFKLNLPAGGPWVLVFFSGNYEYTPHTLFTALETISLNPSVSVLFPLELGVVLGPFSIISAVVIGILVLSNAGQLVKLRGIVRKLGLSIALPAIGVAGGASCCISIPALLAIASPVVYSFLLLSVGIFVQNALYFGLPVIVIMILALNYRSLRVACSV